MSHLILQTAKIIPRNKRLQPSAGSALAYHFEPSDPEQADFGSLLAVVEVLGPTKRAEDIIDQMIQTIGENYYAEIPAEKFDGEERFSVAIRKTNAKIKQIVGKDSLSGRISAVVAVVASDHLYLSSAGAAEGYLFRGTESTSLTNGLANAEDLKTFSAIASGPIQVGDQIALVTPALLHQISQTELKSIIGNATPPSAVTKLTQLLQGQTNLSRTAAVVASITTPELLSLQARPGHPDELQVSDPATLVDTARETVTPLMTRAVQALQTGRKQGVHIYRKNIAPAAKSTVKKSWHHSQKALRNPKIAKVLPIAIIPTLLAGFIFWNNRVQAAQLSSLKKRYHTAFSQMLDADLKSTTNDKVTAQKDLANALSTLDDLSKNKQLSRLDSKLKATAHAENDPANVEALRQNVSERLDHLEGLVRLDSTIAKDFGGSKLGTPSHLEMIKGQILAIGGGGIAIFNKTGRLLSTTATPTGLGGVVATTVNSSGDGVIIVSDQPAIWLFQLSDKSFQKQDLSNGNLPKTRAVSTYNQNLYVLSDDGVYKLTPTLAGFSAPAASIKFSDDPALDGSNAMAIDGSIYIGGGSNGIEQYLAGSLVNRAQGIPSALNKISQVRLLDNGVVLGVDGQTGRVAVLSLGDNLTFSKQLAFNGYPNLKDVLYDPSSGSLYGLAGTKLIKASYRF